MSSDTLLTARIIDWFNSRWAPDMGAIDGHDLRFMASLLAEARPGNLIEIGCATGLSTSVLAMLMDQIRPATVTSFDLDTRFYGDRSKTVGYLTGEIGNLSRVRIDIVTGRASLAAPERFARDSVDFCFIDAAHQHPWPLIDALVTLPLLKTGAFMVFHDPVMAWSPRHHATGPKILQLIVPDDVSVTFVSRVPEKSALALKCRTKPGNIFALRKPDDHRALGARLSQGFLFGWDTPHSATGRTGIKPGFASRLASYLEAAYPPEVAEAFRVGLDRYGRTPVT